MKKILVMLGVATAIFFAGCATNKMYDDVLKPTYQIGKETVRAVPELVPDDKIDNLRRTDAALTIADKVRTNVKTNVGEQDANGTADINNSTLSVGGE